MNCCICLYAPILGPNGRPDSDIVLIDGVSLCKKHGRDVLQNADYVRYWPDGRLCIAGTLDALAPPDFNQ